MIAGLLDPTCPRVGMFEVHDGKYFACDFFDGESFVA